jgi:hypothetical protein
MNNNTRFPLSNEINLYTFKITKKRSPWTHQEDEAIIKLVNTYGKDNWTLISNEMNKLFHKSSSRSGKQCRERWHNHLDPNIVKDLWSEREEQILFIKQMELGNKWSDIAKFLPGRTDNCIKNHFYSKLRKYLRKILKQIGKDGVKGNVEIVNNYNSDKIYTLIKKNKIAYTKINKDTIMNLIIKNEYGKKGGNYNKEDNCGYNGRNYNRKGKGSVLKKKRSRKDIPNYNSNSNCDYKKKILHLIIDETSTDSSTSVVKGIGSNHNNYVSPFHISSIPTATTTPLNSKVISLTNKIIIQAE